MAWFEWYIYLVVAYSFVAPVLPLLFARNTWMEGVWATRFTLLGLVSFMPRSGPLALL